ncbi:TetR family transcriptional regulator [Sporomusaceae bacterium FL31]|nr:TetR family transcriptional regulator [Sporomusaceae bacterium FL31]GCE35440.1 TetR family transcriptional regulator [Sporomusaceae bacterium]
MIQSRGKGTVVDSRNKRQQILEAAYIVFSRKGFHRATVDEIIALADTGKGTVYNYFVNKEQLFYTLIKERSTPFEQSLSEVATAELQPLEKLRAMIKLFLQFYLANADLWRVLMHEVRGLGSEGYSAFSQEQRDKYAQRFKDTIGLLETVINEGIRQGIIKECDASKVSYALFSVVVTMVYNKFVDANVETSANNIADIFFYGVAQ